MPQFISDEVEWSMIPDLVVMDVGYTYTGLRDSRGHKILRRVSRKVGFVHHGPDTPEYVTEADQEPLAAPEDITGENE